jgi:predicted Ser/Thr protein kinase
MSAAFVEVGANEETCMAVARPEPSQVSPEQRQALKPWLEEFDRTWAPGRLVTWVKVLPATDDAVRRFALLELIRIDCRREWARGQTVKAEDYLRNYSELGTSETAPVELVHAEYEARSKAGNEADLAEFSQRFPRQAECLARILQGLPPEPQQPVTAPHPQAAVPTVPAGIPPGATLPEYFGRYRVIKLLGRGGMGSVYLAKDTQLDRQVALKVPYFHADEGPERLKRFNREARLTATLQHPGICPVYDFGDVNGTPFLTMAFIEGKPLSEIPRGPVWTPTKAATLIRQIALALQEAHERQVIHRDLKPSNIMINPRGEPVVMDFGLARLLERDDQRLTQSGAILGTPSYMSPEQLNGDVKTLGPATDVYSLGVILYELLTDQLPYDGPPALMLATILTRTPTPPREIRQDLDPWLEAICLKAMAKKVEDRYPSMAALVADLTAFIRGAYQSGRTPTPVPFPAARPALPAKPTPSTELPPLQRPQWQLIGLLVLVGAALGLAVLVVWMLLGGGLGGR